MDRNRGHFLSYQEGSGRGAATDAASWVVAEVALRRGVTGGVRAGDGGKLREAAEQGEQGELLAERRVLPPPPARRPSPGLPFFEGCFIPAAP